jgi:hypothetical protein
MEHLRGNESERIKRIKAFFNNKDSERYKQWYSKVHNSEVYKKKGETMKQRYREIIFKESVGFQKGDKNPMNNPLIREKVSRTLKQQFKNGRKSWITGKKAMWVLGDKNPSARPDVRKKISEKLRSLIEKGDSRVLMGLQKGWNNHPASKPKYPDGSGNLLRSKNEVKVAKVLQELGLNYIYEPKICGYFPDFQLIIEGKISNKLIEFDGGMRDENIMKKKIMTYTNNGYDVLVLKSSSRISIKESIVRWLNEKKNNSIDRTATLNNCSSITNN